MEEVLFYLACRYEGQFDQIYKALLRKEKVDELLLNAYKRQLKSKYITIVSPEYPECLKQIACPPFVLFYYGDLSLLQASTIGVIGMRSPSTYGKQVTDYLVKGLVKEDYVIVSGMALGIDALAAKAAIENGGKTIAVLGSGIDYCYPKRHQPLYDILVQDHLVISEYPFALAPQKWQFPARNRLIAGLSKGLLVCEAKIKSGTMITVGYALDQGKEVMCVPSSIFGNAGCNELIRQGAKSVICAKDIIDLL